MKIRNIILILILAFLVAVSNCNRPHILQRAENTTTGHKIVRVGLPISLNLLTPETILDDNVKNMAVTAPLVIPFRLGIIPLLELDFKFNSTGVGVNTKWQILRNPFDLAIFGGVGIIIEQDIDNAFGLDMSYEFGVLISMKPTIGGFSIYGSVFSYGNLKGLISTEETGISIAGTFGLEQRLSDRFDLLFEVTIAFDQFQTPILYFTPGIAFHFLSKEEKRIQELENAEEEELINTGTVTESDLNFD